MNHTYPFRQSDQDPNSLTHLDEQALPETMHLYETEKPVKWGAIIFLGIYFLSLWAPPSLPLISLRWYMVLGLAIFAFLLQKRRINLPAASPFWVVYGLSFYGALISLLRAYNLELAFWNTMGFGVSFVVYLLFIPIVATRQARKAMLVIMIGAAILWVFEIQRLVRTYGILYYSTFGVGAGEDKNSIAIIMAVSATTLFYLAILWKPSRALPQYRLFVIRLLLATVGTYFIYNVSLIYGRSSLLSSFLGIGAVLVVLFFKSPKESRFLRIGVIILILVLVGILIAPQVVAVSPQWDNIFNTYKTRGLEASSILHRILLFQKGVHLVRGNPFLGVGIGGSRAIISSYNNYYPVALIHNTYLTDWAEKGILGLASYLVWILAYIKIVRAKFLDLPAIDQIWLVLAFQVFFVLYFFDMNTLGYAMLLIFTGIYYEQYHLDQTKIVPTRI